MELKTDRKLFAAVLLHTVYGQCSNTDMEAETKLDAL